MRLTEGTLLNGRVRYAQPESGYYRTGIEPVFLAAAIPAQPGERVLEAGTGAGASLLCLMTRVPGLKAAAIEIDPAMADVARANLRANALDAVVHTADVAAPATIDPADHVFANPPWHDPASTSPAAPQRALAKQSRPAGLTAWIKPLASLVRPGGTLTLVLAQPLEPKAALLCTASGLARIRIVPLWPRQGDPAKLILLQARHGRIDHATEPGMVLHPPGRGGYTAEADGVLRHANAIKIS